MNILERVQSSLDILSKSEKKVAEVVLTTPQTVIHSSIALMAKTADVSEPTVNRFCRRMATKGFPDFKLQLAQSIANGPFILLPIFLNPYYIRGLFYIINFVFIFR